MKALTSHIMGFAGKFRRLGRNPVFDWYCSLAVFFGLLLVVLGLSAFIYVRIGNADIPIPATESVDEARVDFNVDSIGKTLGGLREKRESARSIPSSVLVDPSL